MNDAQKREYLSKLYGPSWALRVSRMSEKQVAAIYLREINKRK